MTIQERDDVRWALVVAYNENDGGVGYMLGFDGVTQIKIVKRHGPMDWLPYVEVWQGDHLYAEMAQHQCLTIEFKPPAPHDQPVEALPTASATEASARGNGGPER